MATETLSMKYPFQWGASAFPAARSGDLTVSDQIRALLTTGKGERVMRPTLGIDAMQLIFGDLTPITRAKLAADTVRAINEWVPRAQVVSVDVHAGTGEDDQNVVYVDLTYTVAGQQISEAIPVATVG